MAAILKCTFLLVVLANPTEGQGVVKNADMGNGLIWAVNSEGYTLTLQLGHHHHWRQIQNPLLRMNYVSVSPTGTAYGVDKHDDVYVRLGTSYKPGGTYWLKIGGKLEQLSAGNYIVWGVDKKHQVFYRTGITFYRLGGTSWRRVDGAMTMVSVGPWSGSVWAVNNDNEIFFRTGVRGPSHPGFGWKKIEGWGCKISVGQQGVYIVNQHGDLYYRDGTYGGIRGEGTGWTKVPVPAKMEHVSSRASEVICVSEAGDVWMLLGLSNLQPTGDNQWMILKDNSHKGDTVKTTSPDATPYPGEPK